MDNVDKIKLFLGMSFAQIQDQQDVTDGEIIAAMAKIIGGLLALNEADTDDVIAVIEAEKLWVESQTHTKH